MSEFRECMHYLFEPVVSYHQPIRDAYSRLGIKHELIGSAVSDQNGLMYQHLLSADYSGKVTHSQLLPNKTPDRFGGKLLNILETPVTTLDSYFDGNNIVGNYIVKIDVDGIEEKIIDGGHRIISKATMVIVEANLANLTSRASRLESLGLRLFDIVGNCYYCDQLQQVDLVFLRASIFSENIDFRPFEKTGKVIWEYWDQYE